jgi:hypothetical protein
MAARSFVHSYSDHNAAVTGVKVVGDVVISSSQDGTLRVSSFARLAYSEQVAAATAAAAALAATGSGGGKIAADDIGGSEDDGDSGASEAEPGVDHPTGGSKTDASPSRADKDGAAASSMRSTFTAAFSSVPLARVFGKSGTGTRGQHKFESALRLKGHSGPVTALDAWERPEEAKRDWLGRIKESTVDPDAPRQLPCTSNYIIVSGGADGTVRTWAAKWRVNKRGNATGRALHLATHSNLHKSGTVIEHVRLSGVFAQLGFSRSALESPPHVISSSCTPDS